jgi:patatin-like phospholipase/acyl hydrolase
MATAGFFINYLYQFLSKPAFQRENIDNLLTEMFGTNNITDSISSEILLLSYAYNHEEPRFFSKLGSNSGKPDYQITIADAVRASSAAPTYFMPF